mgnify:CR=1 FL=1
MTAAPKRTSNVPQQRLGIALLIISVAQLMLVLDDTIANIALPSIQQDFGITASILPWIVNAYILAFGGLLLFGGRVGDVYGRRRVLRIGMSVFTLASLLCGIAPNAETLIASRGLQGIGAALTAPNALALIAVTFPAGKERNAAMATYGAMSALGIVGGVIVGGFLTGVLGWRWVFLINVPIGIALLLASGIPAEGERHKAPLDAVGAVIGAGAMFSLTFAVTHAAESGWGDAITIGMFALTLILGILFGWNQSNKAQPMMPLSLFQDRNRSGSYATMVFVGAGLMGTFYLLALHMQQVMLFSPIWAGVGALPFSVGIILGSVISSKLAEKLAPRLLAGPGLVVAAGGMVWLSGLEVDSTYLWHVMPALFLSAFGLGVAAVTLTLTAVHGVAGERAGIASALLNASQQTGAALGLAVFTTIATLASRKILPEAAAALQTALSKGDEATILQAREALTAGYANAFGYGAVFLVIAAVLVVLTVNTRDTQGS